MKDFISLLEVEFEENANEQIALQQKAYMRNQFEFYGIKSPLRREIQKPFLAAAYLPPKSLLDGLVRACWAKEYRIFHYFAQELAFKYVKKQEVDDIELYEFMIMHQSWWDTVDYIAPKLVGSFFKKYPQLMDEYINKWLDSGNVWLQRSAILYQLKYKKDLDTNRLEYVIKKLLGSKEFFINKAIGWILREHSRLDPQWVLEFVAKTDLQPLSRREGVRLIK